MWDRTLKPLLSSQATEIEGRGGVHQPTVAAVHALV